MQYIISITFKWAEEKEIKLVGHLLLKYFVELGKVFNSWEGIANS